MLKKISASGLKVAQKSITPNSIFNPRSSRAFTTFAEKERGEEAKYFKAEDAKKIAQLKANLESILAKEDGDATKANIIELLSTEPEKKPATMLSKLGLDDWKLALPIGGLVAVPTLVNEVIVLSAETQLLCIFVICVSTLYTQGGAAIAAALDDYSNGILKSLQKVDENILNHVHVTIADTEKILDIEEDIKSLHALTDNLQSVQAQILNNAEQHKYREAIVKKLDALVALEESVASAVRTRIVSTVKADVLSKFSKDEKIKEAALAQAVAILAAGPSAKLGKDIVGEAFGASLKSYREQYAKQAPEKDSILSQLQADVKAVIVPPVVESKGGNVYETHQLI